MNFVEFREVLNKHMNKVLEGNVFEVAIDRDEIVDIYLASFPTGTNEIFRKRRWHDCSCCKSFIKQIGGLVSINNGVVTSIWDFNTGDTTYQPVIDALSKYVHSKSIENIFATKESKYGIETNYEYLGDGGILTFDHFYLETPPHLKLNERKYDTVGTYKGEMRAIRDVFKRSLEEISEESILTVLELVSQNSLYKGNEWQTALTSLLSHNRNYRKSNNKEAYLWENTTNVGIIIGKIKNHSIGVLLTDITEGMDLDMAVRRYEKIVAPENYKRPNTIFTKKMVEGAEKKILELGYMNSLGRRYATLDDITVNNILFCNRDSAKRIVGSVFDSMLSETTDKNKFSKVEEISIEDFVNKVLPLTSNIEVYLENSHRNNMVSLIAPKNIESKTMFKWNNNFSWAYTGNITDSSMKERVKSAGGKVDGVLRFSIQWNDIEKDNNDLDAYCIEPNGNKIYFRNKVGHTNGRLDVDIRVPKDEVAVENITWSSTYGMSKGIYKFYVNNFDNRGGRGGFRAEIEFNGEVYSFDYSKELRDGENVYVAEVTFDGSKFSIKELLPSTNSSRKVWNLDTNNFVPTSVVMHSPNYWDEQQGIGNKHYFFMLKGCENDESPNGFYNEFLDNELNKHRKVLEAIGSKMRVEHAEDQLSGLGFSATRRAELIVKVHGMSTRVLKIKF